MFNSPAGGSGELFPSPAKGHTDEGLTGGTKFRSTDVDNFSPERLP